MITPVEDHNVVVIPSSLAREHGIAPGSRLDWQPTGEVDVLSVKILPDYRALAASLMGAGRRFLQPGADPIGDLIEEREQEDPERRASL